MSANVFPGRRLVKRVMQAIHCQTKEPLEMNAVVVVCFVSFFLFSVFQLERNALSCSCRLKSSLSPDKKNFISEGPSLEEFILGEASPRENPYKRKKGQR